jgi:alditol oxidase
MATNWAGNVTYSSASIATPATLDELRSVVAAAPQVHAVGAGHSFSRIADTTGVLVSLDRMPADLSVGSTVRVPAGMRLAALASWLHSQDLALHAMPSLPHITIAGAVATATHGSGDRHGSLASAVRSIDLVTASGDVVTLSSPGAVVSFGALGVVSSVELAVVPTYSVAQQVWETVPWPALLEGLDAIFASASSVSAFVDWAGGGARLWVKSVDTPPDLSWTGASPASGPRHPIVGQPTENCTLQGGVPGPWHERLPHFRAEFTPSVGAELQSEYFVPRSRAASALAALASLAPLFAPLVQACEIRTVAADEHWLSPAYDTDSLAVHFTWVADTPAVMAVLPQIEEAMAPRPHWGKLFTVPPSVLAARYPRWADFAALRAELDPVGKFRNEFVDRFFPATGLRPDTSDAFGVTRTD